MVRVGVRHGVWGSNPKWSIRNRQVPLARSLPGGRGNIRTARRTAFDILVAAQKMADLDLHHKKQNKCAPRGVSKVCPISPSILR